MIVCTIVLFIEIFCSSKDTHHSNPLYFSPESIIYKYWSFLDQRDYRNALHCFFGHKDDYYDSTLIYPIPNYIDSLKIDSIISKKYPRNNVCIIFYRVEFYSKSEQRKKQFITGDKLVWTKDGWKIDEVLTR